MKKTILLATLLTFSLHAQDRDHQKKCVELNNEAAPSVEIPDFLAADGTMELLKSKYNCSMGERAKDVKIFVNKKGKAKVIEDFNNDKPQSAWFSGINSEMNDLIFIQKNYKTKKKGKKKERTEMNGYNIVLSFCPDGPSADRLVIGGDATLSDFEFFDMRLDHNSHCSIKKVLSAHVRMSSDKFRDFRFDSRFSPLEECN